VEVYESVVFRDYGQEFYNSGITFKRILNMKIRNNILSRVMILLVSTFLLSACGENITKLTLEEATRIMEQESDYPRVKTIEIPAKVHKRDWYAAYNKSGFLRKLVEADLMEVKEATAESPFYELSPTEEGAKFLLKEGEIQSGGDFGRGYYLAKQAAKNYVKVTEVAEMIRFKGPPPSIELQVTDVHFDISLSDLTPFGTTLGLKEGQIEAAKTGMMWKKTAWKYMGK
jgi:hypothetical protein